MAKKLTSSHAIEKSLKASAARRKKTEKKFFGLLSAPLDAVSATSKAYKKAKKNANKKK